MDEHPEIAEAFQVQSIPVVLLIMNKRLVDQFKGAIPSEQIERTLDAFADVIRNGEQNQQPSKQQEQQIDADAPEYLIGIAAQLMQKGELDEASKVYSQVVEKAVDRELPDFAAKGLSGLLTITLCQYKMDAAKSIINRLKKDYFESTKSDKEIATAMSLYEIYEEAGEDVVKSVNEGKPVESLTNDKDKALHLFLKGQHKEAIELGISLLKKSATKADGKKVLILILQSIENQEDKKKLVIDTRKRMASLLF